MSGAIRLLACFVLLAFGSIWATGQDLGSSNKLFGGSKGKIAPTRAKKDPLKRPSTAKRKSPAKPSPGKTSTAKAAPRSEKGVPSKTPKIETKAEPKVDPPNNAAADALYDRLIDEGNAARDDRSYSKAETANKRARGIKERDPRAIFGLGSLYSDQQRWDDAEKAYRSALQLESDNAVTNIALSYVLSQPIVAANLGERYEEAERLARRAIQLAPRDPLAFDQLGVSMELRGLISVDTENAYRTAIRLDPSFAPPYAHLGRLLRRRGLVKESAEAYEKAVKRATGVPTMILVADVLQSEQRYAESEPLLKLSVAADPRNPTALLLLGQALTTMGQFADAERYLRRGLEVSANGFMPNLLLGSLYLRQNKLELAEGVLMQAVSSVSTNEKRRLSIQMEKLGDEYLKAQKSAYAARVYKQAAALDSENQSLGTKLAKAQHS